VVSGSPSKSKKKKSKKKGGSQAQNKVEEDAQVNGNHGKTGVDHDDDVDDAEEQAVRSPRRK